ncbi:MAG: selenide, water dikinase SelD, partial [Pseudomonadota bacterium]
MTPEVALSRDVVLVGGGHAHALALRHWAMHPMPGARLTVINPGPTPPYTGMLPGFIAGHYRREEIEIDLFSLCHAAGARLILGLVEGIDPATKTLRIADRPPVPYDIASFDIGVHSSVDAIPGFVKNAVPAKPLARLSIAWSDYLSARTEGDIAVLGGGLAGVELAMATQHRLKKEGLEGTVRIIECGQLLKGSDASLRRRLTAALQSRGVQIVENATVTHVLDDHLVLEDGTKVPAILTIGATGARPWPWLQTTSLPLVNGFIEVDANLGVVGHDDLYAVGDCAHLSRSPRPKAGVYAVRAAPILAANIEADLYKRPRRGFRPQNDFLKLVSLGSQSAIGHRGGWAAQGPWLWRLKDRIDRKFMARLSEIPQMQARSRGSAPIAASVDLTQPLCAACGGKVGSATLQSAISGTQGAVREDVRVPLGDDAAILCDTSRDLVFTTDHIRAFDADPRRVAIIAALHALGDVYAMGADPQAALAQITLPRLSQTLQMRWLTEINTAAGEIFAHAGATLAGGHTAMGSELIIGFSVTGLLKQAPITLAGALPGDR